MTSSAPSSRLDDSLLFLARKHPREGWDASPKLGDLGRFWLQRHEAFRKLDALIREATDAAASRAVDENDYRRWLARHVNMMLGQLEEHHHVEDHHYFPVFRRAEPLLGKGFDLLDNDHGQLHEAIEGIADLTNVFLRAKPDDVTAHDALQRFRDGHRKLGAHLVAHLDDEEDLIIPLLIERGEDGVLGG
jgi:iron-sulfur cluster repair protein YtfE (RIC family)